MGKNKQQGGRQQGATRHAPSQHGPKTRARQADIAHATSERKLSTGPNYDHTATDELSQRSEPSKSKRKS